MPSVLDLASVQAYGHYYDVAFPNRPSSPPRGQRRSATYDRLAARGAVFGAKFGYERADWFDPDHVGTEETPTFGRSNAWEFVAAEHAAVRSGVGVIDQSSFCTFDVTGRNALSLLQRVAGADVDTAVGRITYTQLLNERGGIEADVTITRLADHHFYLVTGSGFGRHDVTFLRQHAPDDGTVVITDVTSGYGVLNVCGPRSREVVSALSTADFSTAAFPYMTAQRVDIGWAPAIALRATYTGELGWEFHIPTEYVRDVYDKIVDVGAPLGIRDIGYRAVETLRLEKQYLAWAFDMGSQDTPYEVGLGFCVAADKPELLAGPALKRVRQKGPAQRLRWFTTDADVVMHGGEMLVHDESGHTASVRTAGYGHTIGLTTFCAPLPADIGTADGFEVEVANTRYPAVLLTGPLYDPKGERVRA